MATERTVLVRLKADANSFNRAMVSARASLHGLRDEIDTTNDRTAWLAQSILGLGPALVPIGAVAVPAMAALVAQMTVAGIAAGTLGLAFNGVGDGLKALNDYQLAPTAENLDKMRVAMDKLGPDGAHFVRFLDDAGSQLTDLQMVSRAGVFPGMEEGITSLLTRLPEVKSIVGQVASGLGELSAEAGEGLAGGRFNAFFEYIESDAKPILMDMGRTVGFLTEGFANLLVGFGPMTMSFSDGMEGMARSFAEWSRSLDSNTSFQSFLDYIRESGPRVIEFLGSLVHAFASILEAAAPVGSVLLPVFASLLDALANLADTPLGPIFLTAAAAMSIYGRAAALASITTGGLLGTVTKTAGTNARTAVSFQGLGAAMSVYARNALTAGAASERMAAQSAAARSRILTQGKAFAGTAAQVGLLALSASGLADKMGVANTTTYALLGTMAAPGVGTAIGGLIGGFMDLRAAGSGVVDVMDRLQAAMDSANVDQLHAALTQAKSELEDLRHTTGLGDAVSDDLKRTWGLLQGKGFNLNESLKKSIGAGQDFDVKINADKASKNLYELGGAARTTGAGMRYAGMSVQDFQAHIQALNNALEGRASLRDYEQALDDFRKGLRKNGQSFDINTQKGRQNQAMLDTIAATAIKVTKGLKQTDQQRVLSAARVDFIRAAVAGGMAEGAARKLATRVLGLNSVKGYAHVDLKGVDAVGRGVSTVRQELRNLDGANANVYVSVHRRGASVHAPNIVADGGQMIARTNLGETKGPRDDTIPALLSHREYVQPVAAVDYYGERFMEAVRNRSFPRPQGYAEGGLAGVGHRVSVAAPNVQTGDVWVRVGIDGRALRAEIDAGIDERRDVDGSYARAARRA